MHTYTRADTHKTTMKNEAMNFKENKQKQGCVEGFGGRKEKEQTVIILRSFKKIKTTNYCMPKL